DGDRVLLGQLVSTDSAGNRYWHLFMNVGHSDSSIDLMPGTTHGALFDGMSEDGGMVYYTTVDIPTGSVGGDGDTSADIFRADVAAADPTVTRVSSGEAGTGETDSCDPAPNTRHPRWNSLSATPSCDVLAVGGGGGVASSGDAIYFLSPEKLDTADPENQPVQDAPNLYMARPGSPTRFIATLESGANAPLPPSVHPYQRSFGAFGNVIGAAMDASNGDIYVIDLAAPSVSKYDSEGNPIPAFGTGGAIPAVGVFSEYGVPSTIAVDNDPTSPNYRNLLVPATEEGKVKVFSPAGAHEFDVELPVPTGVAVDPGSGNIYVASFIGFVFKFAPDGTPLGAFETAPAISNPTAIAVDSSGRVYISDGGGLVGAEGKIEVYTSSGTHLTQLDPGPAKGVAVDPADDHVYVDKGNEVRELDPSWNPVGSPIGVGRLGNSVGLGVAGGSLAVSNRGSSNVALFGPSVIPPDPAVDSPLVIDSLGEAATRHSDEFQVNRSGDNAVFTSTLQLTDYENVARREVIRYDSDSNEIDCASCNPTGEPASGEASLAADGRSLTDDGRVFFDSTEGLVDRDLNDVKDAYEWEEGEDVQLISTGTAPLASSLLGVSADGVDAYFFTRQTLVAEDENGSRVKIYNARSFGGFPYVPPPVPCKASDECHGPGSQAPPPPQVRTIAGTPIGNVAKPKPKCKRGKKKCRRRRAKHHKAGRRGEKHSHRGDRRE
ncbi:MAG TPA: NHL repeat-containing protein, partial [Candidatus Limnocylindrales bacterium]|nr:NHL repeat-containing protein [Candidatus Limnocylindrales bacterium]